MWQYSSKGSVSGISGNVDLNHCYKDYPSIIKESGLNGFGNSSSSGGSNSNNMSDDYVLDWPLAGEHVITAGYYYSGGSLHRAIDLRVDYQ